MRFRSPASALSLAFALGLGAIGSAAAQQGLSVPGADAQVRTGLTLPSPAPAPAPAMPPAAAASAAPAAAAPALPSGAPLVAGGPDAASVPMMQVLTARGASAHFIGKVHGLDGWIVVYNGQIQTLYTSPDGQAMVMGLMTAADGTPVTMQQLSALEQAGVPLASLADPAASPTNAARQAAEQLQRTAAETVARINAIPGEVDPPAAPAATAGTPDRVSAAPPTPVASAAPALPAPIVQAPATAPVAPTAAPAATPVAARSGNTSAAEQFFQQTAAGHAIEIGRASAPLLYIFVDPACPYCKAYYRDLQKHIDAGEVRVKLLPVGMVTEQSADLASLLMASASPTGTWNEIAHDNYAALRGVPTEAQKRPIADNTDLLLRHNITSVPFSVYRGLDDRVMVVAGQPPDLTSVLSNLRGR